MVTKRLKDFPLNEWMDSASFCDCDRRFKVRVNFVDESGNFGDIEYKVEEHAPDCPMRYDEETGEDISGQIEQDIAGWEYAMWTVKLLDREFTPIVSRVNHGPCLECGLLIVDVPLILFLEKGKRGELDFCHTCFEKLLAWKASYITPF